MSLLRPCQDDDELHAWVRLYTGLRVPRTPVCPGHDAPFDWGQRAGGIMLLVVALLAFFLGVYPQPLLELVQQAGPLRRVVQRRLRERLTYCCAPTNTC